MRTRLTAGLLVAAALLAAGCDDGGADEARLEGDCIARLGVDGEVLDPVGADPSGRRGDPVPADVLGCDGEPVEQVRARPVTRDGELLGYEVTGDYRGFYSTDSLVEPIE